MFIKHKTTKIPSNVKRQAILKTIMYVISSIFFQSLAFALQLGKNQIVAGNIVIGLLFITVYYCSDILRSLLVLLRDSVNDIFKETSKLHILNTTANILSTVRGKVWCKNEENNSSEIMPPNTIMHSCKQYIGQVVDFKTNLPRSIIDLCVLIFSFFGFLVVSAVEIKHTILFITIIVISIAFSVLVSLKRTAYRKTYWKSDKKFSQKQDVLLNDIVNIEPLNRSHSEYMISNFISAGRDTFHNDKAKNRKFNIYYIFDSLFDCIATISIIGIKIWEIGFANVNFEMVLSIISLMTIYSSIVISTGDIIRNIEDLLDAKITIKSYEDDFKKIIKVYDEENQTEDDFYAHLYEIDVPKFEAQYPVLNNETPFLLKNPKNLTFESGDIVLLVGPTGSGKSTLLKLVTNYMNFDSFKLNFKCTNGRIGTVMHQTDGKIGSNDILSEITFGKRVDVDKLFHILKGLHLYEEISAKDMDVIRYLRNSKINNYSTGQKQRLAIARLLYNLNDDIQIIAFDEATNALNDEITLQTLGFIKEFCEGKLLFIATHQVDIGETVANKIIEFVPSGTHYEIKQTL